MSGSTMAYWRDPLRGGAPRTSRPLEVKEIECVNGTVINMTVPSEDTVRVGVTGSGVRYFEVVTPTVVNVVANQFDCKAGATAVETIGARLDNFEHFDCIGSHWSSRYFADETMVSRNMPWEQSISAVTLALFEDTGWYKANFSAAEPASFGYGAGCDFLTSDCILDDGVPEFGEDTFCKTLTDESAIRCDVSHKRFTKW
jgi:leishmanolysin-like peptidase